jgi:hypothetical protein
MFDQSHPSGSSMIPRVKIASARLKPFQVPIYDGYGLPHCINRMEPRWSFPRRHRGTKKMDSDGLIHGKSIYKCMIYMEHAYFRKHMWRFYEAVMVFF